MAGLLDSMFASSTDDPRYASNMALFAGAGKGDFLGGLLAASEAGAKARQQQQESAYKQLMAQNLQSEMAQRAAKMKQAEEEMAFRRQFMGIGGPSAAGGAPAGQMPGATPGGAPAPQGGQAQGGGFTAQQISQQFGVPLEAVIADFQFNDGKKIAELIEARSKPNWQNINGNLVNTNAPGFQGGIQAGINAGNNGQVTMWQPDGKGGVVVGAPRGALDTFRAYQGIQEGTKADFDPLTITPPSGRPVMSTRGNVVREVNQPMPQPQSGVNGAFVGDPAQVAATIAQIRDPQERANAQAAFDAQMRQSGGRLGIPLQSEAEAAGAKERAVKGASADVERQAGKTKKADSATEMLNNVWRARVLLESDPTGSLAGAGVDKVLGAFGKSTPSAQNADRLESLSGWLVSNVPRMEGPQSNFDVENYKTMAGRIGDRTYPVAGRLAALEEVERIQKRYAHLNSDKPEQKGGATGDFDAPKGKTVDTLPKVAPKGARARDLSTNQIMVFNGMSWVPEKK